MTDALAGLQKIYARVPEIDCRGLCSNSCGPIDMSAMERRVLRDRGVEIPVFTAEAAARWANQERLDCPALGAFKQCTVYDVRPLICRLWGVAESMPCVWGCRPKTMLSDVEAMDMILESMHVGGDDHNNLDRNELASLMKDADVAPVMARIMRGEKGEAVLAELERLLQQRGITKKMPGDVR